MASRKRSEMGPKSKTPKGKKPKVSKNINLESVRKMVVEYPSLDLQDGIF